MVVVNHDALRDWLSLDRLYEEAGRELAAHVWSDRIYWPLMGIEKYWEFRDRALREGDPTELAMREHERQRERHDRIREWLHPLVYVLSPVNDQVR